MNRSTRSVVVAIMLGSAACKGDSTSPSVMPTATTTITITSNGVSPKAIVIGAGSQVNFVNNDSRQHEMDSDPHPEHTDCPAINQVDLIVAGQSKQTGNLNVVRTCGYHDHLNEGNQALHGTITIQ